MAGTTKQTTSHHAGSSKRTANRGGGVSKRTKDQNPKTGPQAGTGKRTTNHNVIRKWVEARGGKPATVQRTGGPKEAGILRIDFPGYSGKESLHAIPWDEFFDKFDEKNLVFLYQDKTASGRPSRFCKFVSQQSAKTKARG